MTRWISAVVLATTLLLARDAWAASPTEQLRGFFASATHILDDPRPELKPEDRLNAVRGLVRDFFDFREAARLALGPEWSARTPQERAEFVRLFTDLLERSFIFGIAGRVRLADGVQVSYRGESVDGALATVWTAIAIRNGLDLPFNYKMIERGGRWAVRDVVIDGVSLAANYHAQFVRIIQISSYRDLVSQMRARLSEASTVPLVATVVEDGHAVSPGHAPPAASEPARAGSPEAPPRQALAPAPPESSLHDGRSPQTRPATTMLVARVEPDPAPGRPIAEPADGASREEPVTAEPSWNRPAQLGPVRVAMTTQPVTTRVAGARSYWVQVGAFADPQTARRLASVLREQEPHVSPSRWVVLDPAPLGTPLARVRVGPFSGRGEATAKLRELETQGYKPFITEARD
jgi:phospholipid transport system substrate-binding protein